MDKRHLTKLINHPGSIDELALSGIDELQNEFMYFSALYLVSAKGKKELNKSDFQLSLQKAALYSTNRALLKSYILKTTSTTATPPIEKSPTVPAEKPKPTPAVVTVSPPKKEEQVVEVQKPVRTEQPIIKQEVTKEKLPSAIVKGPIEFEITEPKGLSALFYKELAENMASLDDKKKKLNALFDEMDQAGQAAPKQKVVETKTQAAADSSKIPAKKEVDVKPKKEVTKKTEAKKVTPKKSAPAKKKEVVEKVKKEKMSRADMINLKKVKLKKEAKPTEQEHLVAEIAKKKEKKIADKKVLEQSALIDKFIASEPQITKNIKKSAKNIKSEPVKDLSEKSTFLTDDLVSENLAQIFVKQGKISQAIDIYKKLIWKFPQKKSYFATQIEKLTTI